MTTIKWPELPVTTWQLTDKDMQAYGRACAKAALEAAAEEAKRVVWLDRKTPPYKRDREPHEIADAIRKLIEELP